MLFAGWEVHMVKTAYDLGQYFQDRGPSFSPYGRPLAGKQHIYFFET